MKLSVRGRGPTTREVFTPLTATERALSRINVSNRQGGRGPDRARLRDELGFPAPPRPRYNPPTERVGELRHLMRLRDIFLMATGRPPPS